MHAHVLSTDLAYTVRGDYFSRLVLFWNFSCFKNEKNNVVKMIFTFGLISSFDFYH